MKALSGKNKTHAIKSLNLNATELYFLKHAELLVIVTVWFCID